MAKMSLSSARRLKLSKAVQSSRVAWWGKLDGALRWALSRACRSGARAFSFIRGPGLPAGFDPDRSLGLKIARALTADQLRGELMLEDASPGVRARLTWSVA